MAFSDHDARRSHIEFLNMLHGESVGTGSYASVMDVESCAGWVDDEADNPKFRVG